MAGCASVVTRFCFLATILVSAHAAPMDGTINEIPSDLPDIFYPGAGNRLQVGSEEFLKNYASLAGLEGVYVILDYVIGSSQKNKIELRKDDLEEQVRQRLQNAGLRMLTEDEMPFYGIMPTA